MDPFLGPIVALKQERDHRVKLLHFEKITRCCELHTSLYSVQQMTDVKKNKNFGSVWVCVCVCDVMCCVI